jgi:hypothetical protein
MQKLYKLTVTIWTDCDPCGVSLERLGYEADRGNAIAAGYDLQAVNSADAPVNVQDFFGIEEYEADHNEAETNE